MIELHTSLRFAWLQQKSANPAPTKQPSTHPLALIRTVYNAAFWVFLVPFFTAVPYSIGFISFTTIIVLRFALSLYTNNALTLTPQQYAHYPFRI